MSKKKIITHIIIGFVCILALIITVCLLCIPRLDYSYDKKTDSYEVSKAWGYTSKFVVPETHNGKPVTKIGVRAFYQHADLVEVVFEKPENIMVIDRLAFSECPKLESIDLTYVNTIERNAFSYDYALDNITTSAIKIGGAAFLNCSSLKHITISEGNSSLGSQAFMGTAIEEITLPYSTSKVNVDCFYGLDNLKIYAKGEKLKSSTYLADLNVIYIE